MDGASSGIRVSAILIWLAYMRSTFDALLSNGPFVNHASLPTSYTRPFHYSHRRGQFPLQFKDKSPLSNHRYNADPVTNALPARV
jgi:hypothetical protein